MRLVELVEYNDFVNSVEELRAELPAQLAQDFFLLVTVLLGIRALESEADPF
jgi:hypothetical protein